MTTTTKPPTKVELHILSDTSDGMYSLMVMDLDLLHPLLVAKVLTQRPIKQRIVTRHLDTYIIAYQTLSAAKDVSLKLIYHQGNNLVKYDELLMPFRSIIHQIGDTIMFQEFKITPAIAQHILEKAGYEVSVGTSAQVEAVSKESAPTALITFEIDGVTVKQNVPRTLLPV